jgi:hypothetical protein
MMILKILIYSILSDREKFQISQKHYPPNTRKKHQFPEVELAILVLLKAMQSTNLPFLIITERHNFCGWLKC